MRNTEYKCMCCGWLGNEELLGIDSASVSSLSEELATCPHCGSMDIQEAFQLEDLTI